METQALIFAGIGSLTECAEIDRASWNAAFRAQGLRWNWSWDTYLELMRPGGDRQPAMRYAEFLETPVDDEKLSDAHMRNFAARMSGDAPIRSGVGDVLKWAARQGLGLALVSRSAPGQIQTVLQATARARSGIDFDAVVSRDHGGRLVPHPDPFETALARLALPPEAVIVIADTPASAAAALDAGCRTYAFPGLLAEDQSFPKGAVSIARLSVDALMGSDLDVTRTAAE